MIHSCLLRCLHRGQLVRGNVFWGKAGRKNRGWYGHFRRPTNPFEGPGKKNKKNTLVFSGACHERFSAELVVLKLANLPWQTAPSFKAGTCQIPQMDTLVSKSRILIAKTAFSCFVSLALRRIITPVFSLSARFCLFVSSRHFAPLPVSLSATPFASS